MSLSEKICSPVNAIKCCNWRMTGGLRIFKQDLRRRLARESGCFLRFSPKRKHYEALTSCLEFFSMLRLRLIAGVRHIPSCRNPFYTPARSLYQTRVVAAAAASAAKARPRTPSSRHRPTMQRGRNSRPGSPLSRRRELSEPFNSEKAILASYPPVGVDAKMLKLPKEPLSLYVRKLTNSPPHFVCENGLFEGREYWRYVVL